MIRTLSDEAGKKCYENTDKETIHSWHRKVRDDYRVAEVYELDIDG